MPVAPAVPLVLLLAAAGRAAPARRVSARGWGRGSPGLLWGAGGSGAGGSRGRLRVQVWREGSGRGSVGELRSEGGGNRGRRSLLPCRDPQGNSSFRPRGITRSCVLPTKSNRHGAGS